MTEVMRDLESASVLAVGPLSGIGARIRALGAIANRSTLAIVGLIAGITGAVVVFVKLFAATLKARVEMDRIMLRGNTLWKWVRHMSGPAKGD